MAYTKTQTHTYKTAWTEAGEAAHKIHTLWPSLVN
jgi:hypothetical protein